jgi:hypothetical protein
VGLVVFTGDMPMEMLLAAGSTVKSIRGQFGERSLFVGFGRRAAPDKLSNLKGGYPYDAAFVGFIVYGD